MQQHDENPVCVTGALGFVQMVKPLKPGKPGKAGVLLLMEPNQNPENKSKN